MFCQIDHRWRWRRFLSSGNKFYQLPFCELHDQHIFLNLSCRISLISKFYIACFDKIVLNLLFFSKFSNALLQNFFNRYSEFSIIDNPKCFFDSFLLETYESSLIISLIKSNFRNSNESFEK